MLNTILTINIVLSLTFLFLTHPLSLGLILLMQTLVISLITGNFSFNFWFSYIVFLILIGGMLILFIYMTSVASNEKFSVNPLIFPTSLLTIILSTILINKYLNFLQLTNNETLQFLINNNINISMTKFINFPANVILTFMIIYLFITLIAVVKITDLKHGPLRQKN
uniref:NADH-ubiquinone oxidoreductase chain 6 n=1 Tax=Tenebrionoidea sp. 2 KM-2017 TaxID=2219475 RepID=A0A346RJK1_9CUCU|nr:NADH dehydrogenase subunit 6 [Tenebrionoidea sp. 2 KM-2017]